MNPGGYSVQQSSYSYSRNTASNVGGGNLGGYGGGMGGGSGSGNAVLINSGLTDK